MAESVWRIWFGERIVVRGEALQRTCSAAEMEMVDAEWTCMVGIGRELVGPSDTFLTMYGHAIDMVRAPEKVLKSHFLRSFVFIQSVCPVTFAPKNLQRAGLFENYSPQCTVLHQMPRDFCSLFEQRAP